MTTKPLNAADLDMFTGSETFYRHSLNRKVVYTEDFQVWTLTVRPDHTAALVCEDGNGNVVFSKEIAFTDFPLESITLWFANGTIYLPSEH